MTNNHNFLIDSSIVLLPDWLEKHGNVTKVESSDISREILIQNEIEYLVTRTNVKINKEMLEGTKVKFYSSTTSGFDHVDVKYLDSQNIKMHNAKGCNANSVAEYALFSMIHNYLDKPELLKSKIIGLVGYGNIGKILADYFKRLGLKFIINDPFKKEEIQNDEFEYADLDDLISNSHIITNHVPLTFDGDHPTYHLFNNNLEKAIDLELFIHTSRGFVVDEPELIKNAFLKKFKLVIDVWENEPKPDHDLISQSIISTPHIAGHSYNGKVFGSMMSYYELMKIMNEKISFVIPKLPISKKLDKMSLLEIYQRIELFRKLLDDSKNFKNSASNNMSLSSSFKNLRKFYPIRYESIT